MSYEKEYARSMEDPEGFWGEAAAGIDWYKPWDKVLDDSNKPFYHWFQGGEMNTCYNAVDRHVENGRGDQAAIIYDSPVTDTKQTITYSELKEQVSKFAGVLAGQGVSKGDRVLVYMPMVPTTVVAMLACARIGAVHSVVFGGFASKELATRIDDAKPKVVLSASCGIEGKKITKHLGLVSGEAILGANIFKDFFASIRDIVGGRSQAYEQELQKAKNIALEEMQARADSMGANAIVAVDLDYESIQMGTSNMLMVSASGTAVVYQ